MTPPICHLPDDLAHDIEQHALDVERFQKGEISASVLKSRRVPRGIYEQRQNGTFMLRVRLPGGGFSVEQARALARVASQYGNGVLHVTTRQDIQIHHVKIEETPVIMRALFQAGLTSKGGGGNTVRNVTACPFAGICPAECFDVNPSVIAVTEYLIALAGSYNLPRKYKIAFSGCRADCALAQVTDLGFIAKVRDGVPGFSVYAGGGMGAESRVGDRMEEWVPATDVIRIAEAVRRLFDRQGDRRNRRKARLRFVVERLGVEAFRTMLRELVQAVTTDGIPIGSASVDLAVTPITPRGDFRTLLQPMAGTDVLPQRQPGIVAVPLRLPVGQITWQQLEALANLAERFSSEKMLWATQDQHLLLRFVRERDLVAVSDELNRILEPGIIRNTALHAFTACTGAAICRLGLCLSQNAARACGETLAQAGLDAATLQAVDIRINGCPNACGQHPIGTIGLFGAAQRVGERLVPAYRLLLGARRGEGKTRLGEPTGGSIPARALPAFLAELLRDFQGGRKPGEAFADYFDRKGMGHFQVMQGQYAQAPAYEVDPAFYRDWGCDEAFTLAGRGPGECGAGVFEVVAEDLSAAAKALEPAAQDAASGERFFRGLLATTRALLITRGVDSQEPDVVLRAFETHFVDTGLVDAGFRGLLARARGYREGWSEALADRREEIRRLFDRVQLLFSTMDADLKFHVPEVAAAPETVPAAPAAGVCAVEETASAEMDLRGVGCPMNFVKAKLRLEMMDVGTTLGVLLDDGEPVQNVPASFRNEGQEVLAIRATGDGHWRVIIMKHT